MPNAPIILCDLDSTLCDTSRRAHLATGSKTHADWVEYSKACKDDLPITGVMLAVKALAKIYPLYIISGRNDEAYWETTDWLTEQNLDYQDLRLRREDDIQHNGEYKVAHIQLLRSYGFDPVLMFEDHDGVADMVEAIGVPVVRVRPPYEDTVGVRFNNLAVVDAEA